MSQTPREKGGSRWAYIFSRVPTELKIEDIAVIDSRMIVEVIDISMDVILSDICVIVMEEVE